MSKHNNEKGEKDGKEFKELYSNISEHITKEQKEEYMKLLKSSIDKEHSTKLSMKDFKDRLKYVPNANLFVPTLHLGQRKLFLSELRFLTHIIKSDMLEEKDLSQFLIVYAGAGPGFHIPYLYKLFPSIRMLLIDPTRFQFPRLSDSNFKPVNVQNISEVKNWVNRMNSKSTNVNCLLYNNLMSLEVAKELNNQGHKVLFISDIRTNSGDDVGAPDIDIVWNHYMQMNWIYELEPVWNMLKFRYPFYDTEELPADAEKDKEFALAESNTDNLINVREDYKARKFMYFNGEPWLQAFCGRRSREMRLVFKNNDVLKNYNKHEKVQETFFYYNCIERGFYLHPNSNASEELGFDLCNDCSQENWMWMEYSKIVKPIKVIDHVRNLGEVLHQTLKYSSHGYLFHVLTDELVHKMKSLDFSEKQKHFKIEKSKQISKDQARQRELLLKK